jgi:hypothetical protein
MTDIGIVGLDWFVMALLSLAISAIGIVVQPIVVYVVRKRATLPRRTTLRSAMGPGLALGVASAALALSNLQLEFESRRTMDRFAFALPIAALVLWIAATIMALPRGKLGE